MNSLLWSRKRCREPQGPLPFGSGVSDLSGSRFQMILLQSWDRSGLGGERSGRFWALGLGQRLVYCFGSFKFVLGEGQWPETDRSYRMKIVLEYISMGMCESDLQMVGVPCEPSTLKWFTSRVKYSRKVVKLMPSRSAASELGEC